MFALLRVLFFGALALMAMIPIGIVLVAVGLPIAVACGLVALPMLLVLFLIGLPILIVGAAIVALMGATVGVVMAFLSFGVVALKLAFIVLVPLLILGWLIRKGIGAPNDLSIRG